MIRKKPALGLDPRAEAGFPKRSCSTKILERQSLQNEAIDVPGPRSDRQRLARRNRPQRQVETVRREQRQGQAIDAESDTAGMRQFSGFGPQIPDSAEMVAVVVEAHASGELVG